MSVLVSFMMEAFTNRGRPVFGLWCSMFMVPVMDSVPFTTDGEPFPTWMLSSHGPGT